jgi:predicted metal-dependent phosphoesterase TrpH
MSIDLHVHSVNSDGTDSTEAIIESSIELQLEAICISDHEYLTKVPQQNKIEIIQGVEISVSWDLLDDTNKFGGTHLLVYFLNEESPLDKKLIEMRQNKIKRNYSIIDNLEEFEIYIDKKDLDSLETKVPGRPHIAELMVKKNYVSNISEAFSKYLGNGKIDGIDNHQLGIKEIINLAKQSKSLVFLAHPHTLMSDKLYSKSDNWIDNKFHNYIQTLKDMDIDGIEVYYPGYSHNTINTLLEVCENQKLLVSGGSDFHGSRKPNNLLGIGYENSPTKVPYELLSKMKELHAKL